MGQEDGRASGEVLQEKKKADRFPNTSDYMENTFLRDFQFYWGVWNEVVIVNSQSKKKRQGEFLNLRWGNR